MVKLGVKVDRPTPIDFSQPVQTPEFTTPHQMGCMPPRDVLLTVGSEILEATMSYRCRWFEYLCYRPLLQRYFEEDPDFRLDAAPKPRLTDASFRSGYFADEIHVATRLKWTAERNFVTTEKEILFDSADVARCGRDLFVQHGFTTNLKGVDWLRRHFAGHRVHALHFPGEHFRLRLPMRPENDQFHGNPSQLTSGNHAIPELRENPKTPFAKRRDSDSTERMKRPGFLDIESRQNLIELARDGLAAHSLARRANALVLLDDGMSCEAIAKVLLLDDDTIRTWYRLYEEDGIEGLTNFSYEGSACQLSGEQQEKLKAWVATSLPRTTR